MIDVIIVYLTLISITHIVTRSKLFTIIRTKTSEYSSTLGHIINCPMCFGIWMGLIGGIIFVFLIESLHACILLWCCAPFIVSLGASISSAITKDKL